MLEALAILWISCADGALDYCAPDTFATEAECYEVAETWIYGDDGVCIAIVVNETDN